MHKKTYSNRRFVLPRKEQKKAAAIAAKVLSGLELQPSKLIVDIFIHFNDCKRFEQLTKKVNPSN